LNPTVKHTAAKGSVPLWVALAGCVFLQFWIANGAARLQDPRYRDAWHHYEYLAEGFLQGHTYLSVAPAPQLLSLKDPYDPDANAHFRLWDASLYKGRYYLYFGPTPALFMAAAGILSGHVLPQRLAVAAFAAGGLAGLALLLRDIRKRHFPALSPAALGAILVVAFFASWLPVTIRRPAVWEVPIVASVAFVWWSVYFLWKFHDSGGRARWAVAAGAALAFLIGSRPTFVFAAGAISLLFLVPSAPGSRIAAKWGSGLLAGAVVLAGGLGLLAYNYERFGSLIEFGQRLQLWGNDYWGIPIRNMFRDYYSLRYILFDARIYLLSTPYVGPYFPFLHPAWTGDLPAGHQGLADPYGIVPMMPVHLAGIAACGWAWRNRSGSNSRAAALALAAAVCASLLTGLVLFTAGGVTSRYTTELLSGWTIATSVGLMSVFGSPKGTGPGRGVRVLVSAAMCWSVASVCLASAEFQGCMAIANPRAYAFLSHALDYPSQWMIRERNLTFAPVDLAVRIPDSTSTNEVVLVASGRPLWMNRFILNRIDRRHVQLVLLENHRRVLETSPLPLTGDLLRVRLDAPWLYPPPGHPYWDSLDPRAARERQTLYSIQWDGGAVHTNAVCPVDPVAFEPLVNFRSPDEPDSPYVESIDKVGTAP
jgi:hypothetical protein